MIEFVGSVFLAFAAGAANLEGETLAVATTEHTSDWNPIAQSSYTAVILSKFTTEHLFEKTCVCVGGECDQVEAEFAPLCQNTAGGSGASIALQINPKRCPGLRPRDVMFTLDQIKARGVSNDYYFHQITFQQHPNTLFVNVPTNLTRSNLHNALSFPILRDPELADRVKALGRPITKGGEDLYNNATGGLFQIQQFFDDKVRAVRRVPLSEGSPRVGTIEFTMYYLFRSMIETMNGEMPPGMVLSWPSTRDLGNGKYSMQIPENDASFTFVGFNFRTSDREHSRLVRSERFRQWFTQSVWALREIRAKVPIFGERTTSPKPETEMAPGIFLGESFDTGRPTAMNVVNRTRIESEIHRFLEDEGPPQPTTFTVLLSPAFNGLFEETDRDNIEASLNKMWNPLPLPKGRGGITFDFVEPTGGDRSFESLKNDGKFHMVFDTFIYGRNHLRYMAFVKPGCDLNFLGIDIPRLSKSEVDAMMTEGPPGKERFLTAVKETYPVAVIGQFPRRDLFHNRVTRTEPERSCSDGAVVMTYQGIDGWEIRKESSQSRKGN